ncbi:MAG TPA: hypothetical protein VKP65_16945, partial [Rhodothermales bacterium]|nr:hypothetical protein [Rhodothermales bacterium]
MAGDAKIWGPHDEDTKDRVRKRLAENRAKYGPSDASLRREMDCAEARAALLAEVLAVIDEEYTESDEQRGLREAIDFHDVKCAVLSGLKYRLAAL